VQILSIAPVTVTFNPGETVKVVNVTVNGDTVPEGNETFFLKLQNPTNATIADDTGVGTIINDDFNLTINDATVQENAGTMTFTVTLNPASTQTVTVNFTTANSSAVAPGDYVSNSGSLTFNPGETTKSIIVTINDDIIDEPNQDFTVTLSSAVNAAIADGIGNGTIIDNDPLPNITINDVTITEGNSGTISAVFTLSLDRPSDSVVSVIVNTANGTAIAGSDYTAIVNGPVIFAVGGTTQTVTVLVTGDTANEANETFFVNLSSPNNAAIADGQGTGTIVDNDQLPNITINDVNVNEGNSGTVNATFTVTLSTPSGQTVTVNFATADSTATAGSDYVSNTGTLTFSPGVTTQTITVLISGDTLNEPDETFFVNLTNPTNAAISKAKGTGTIVDNDPQPSITISDATVSEGNSGAATATFTVTLTPASGRTVSVNFSTVDGTATAANGDYVSNTGTLTFSPGETVKVITVLVNGDTSVEADESFIVNLTAPINAFIGDPQGAGAIINDDIEAAPTFPAGFVLPAGACVCTPVIMNTDIGATETVLAKVTATTATLVIYGVTANPTDPETVGYRIVTSAGVTTGAVSYPPPAPPYPLGFEKSATVNLAGLTPGEVIRIEITTPPPTPSTQPHWRIVGLNVLAFGINMPSFRSFEEGRVRWRVYAAAGESINLDLDNTALPTPATQITVARIIKPSGALHSTLLGVPVNAGTEINVGPVAPADAGLWVIDMTVDGHHTITKTTGVNRAIFLDWRSAGFAKKTVVIKKDGVLATGTAYNVEVFETTQDGNGNTGYVLVTSKQVNTGAHTFEKLLPGNYRIVVTSPTGVSTPSPQDDELYCDKEKINTFETDTVTHTLTVTRAGTGNGTVTSVPAGINCGAACAASFTHGTVVTLTATPDSTSTFTGWSGACSGTGACTVTMDAAKSVTATFTLLSHTLTVTRTGTGSGTVTSAPAGINCGAACAASFTHGTVVTLTATADATSVFQGWSGACTGTVACTVSMTSNKAVTATFGHVTDIGDRVWMDTNGNGIQDTGEPNYSGSFTVQLLDTSSAVVYSLPYTAGNWSMVVEPGTYYVKFILPSGYGFTLQNQGSDDTKDSDADPSTGITGLYTFTGSPTTDFTIDAGLVQADTTTTKTGTSTVNVNGQITYTITVTNHGPTVAKNVVTTDALPNGTTYVSSSNGCDNPNGTVTCTTASLGNGETATYTIVVTTTTPGTVINTTTTTSTTPDPNRGDNTSTTTTTVNNRPPTITVPADITIVAASSSGKVVIYSVTTSDPDGDAVTISCSPPSSSTFPIGTTNTTCTATDTHGATASATFTVTVINNPPTITTPSSITVNATSSSGAVVTYRVTTSDPDGHATTTSCSPPSGSTFPIGTTTVTCTVTDVIGATASASFSVTVRPPGSIGNFVWRDINGNGLQDIGEPGVGGVTVHLLNNLGFVMDSTVTNASGLYSFATFAAGDYKIKFIAPAGYTFTLKDQGTDDTRDSDADQTTGNTDLFALPGGTNDVTRDAGLKQAVLCMGKAVTILGTPGNDNLRGTAGDDVIAGLGGNDRINGNGGNDTICGGDGDDNIDGGDGNDRIDGGDGNDRIDGGNGSDTIDGGPGNDRINGNQDNDVIDGGIGNDAIDGGDGNDRLEGGPGNDNIAAGEGEDTADGGAGDDLISGGPGNDNLKGGPNDDAIDGGIGKDTIDGGAGDDDIQGGPGDDTIRGDDGNDTLRGEAGNDALDGGNGNDTLDGRQGRDKLFGGPGNDTLQAGRGDDYLDGGAGTDILDGDQDRRGGNNNDDEGDDNDRDDRDRDSDHCFNGETYRNCATRDGSGGTVLRVASSGPNTFRTIDDALDRARRERNPIIQIASGNYTINGPIRFSVQLRADAQGAVTITSLANSPAALRVDLPAERTFIIASGIRFQGNNNAKGVLVSKGALIAQRVEILGRAQLSNRSSLFAGDSHIDGTSLTSIAAVIQSEAGPFRIHMPVVCSTSGVEVPAGSVFWGFHVSIKNAKHIGICVDGGKAYLSGGGIENSVQESISDKFGWAAFVRNSGRLVFMNAGITDNHEAGVVASGSGTSLSLTNTTLDGTVFGTAISMGLGVVVQLGAAANIEGSTISNNEGSGLYISDGSVDITDTDFTDNQAAGVAVVGGTLSLTDGTITGTDAHPSKGAGVGLYVSHSDNGPSDVTVQGVTLDENLISNVFVKGEGGTVSISNSTMSNATAVTRGGVTVSGFGLTSIGTLTGLTLTDNSIANNQGNQILLDGANITVTGNTYVLSSGGISLKQQDCSAAGVVTPDLSADGSSSTSDICPARPELILGVSVTLTLIEEVILS
jgi:Ca2+-binding RTX toxin-like protein